MAFRERLVKTNVGLKNAIKDLKNLGELIDNTFIVNQSEQQQKLIEKQINDTDKQIEVTLKEDDQIKKQFDLINSVVGIGLITAVAFIIYTQNFTAFSNGRQFACYAGVAPFERYAAAAQLREQYQGRAAGR